jgi:Leucine-rich repeat (LRR) protein
MKLFTIILILATAAFSQDYSSDAAIVRGILDANGWNAWTVDEVTDSSGGRITALNLRGQVFDAHDSDMVPATGIKGYFYITTLPLTVWQLTALEILDINGHELYTISDQIGTLTSLKELYINPDGYDNNTRTNYYGTPLYRWADSLEDKYVASGKMAAMDKFPPVGNLLSLPSTMASLVNLEILDIGNNSIGTLPSYIGNFTKLRKFNGDYTGLSGYPALVSSLTNLTHLSLAGNDFTSIPSSIGALTKLVLLDLNNNRLSSLPAEIGDLTELSINLNLQYNELTTLPAEISSLTKLKKLLVDHNKLSSLPSGIGSLTALKMLDAGCNQLRTVPSSIGGCILLDTIYLDENQLSQLPNEICNINGLDRLHVNHNWLTALPDNIGNLKRMVYLRVHNNQFHRGLRHAGKARGL